MEEKFELSHNETKGILIKSKYKYRIISIHPERVKMENKGKVPTGEEMVIFTNHNDHDVTIEIYLE